MALPNAAIPRVTAAPFNKFRREELWPMIGNEVRSGAADSGVFGVSGILAIGFETWHSASSL
jgi:hypothetical protein